MSASLDAITRLPADTYVYPGHEYTLTNLEFAKWLEPSNQDLESKLRWAKTQRSLGLGTVPSTLISEARTNPYLRTNERAILSRFGFDAGATKVEVIQAIRDLKDGARKWEGDAENDFGSVGEDSRLNCMHLASKI